MPTTAPWIVSRFLEVLSQEGIPYAILHRERQLEFATSDVDVVVGMPIPQLLKRAWAHMNSYVPVMIWPYEAGGASNLFLVTPDMTDGAQIDLLFDPSGKGRLGLRSATLLRHRAEGTRFPTLSHDAELIYLLLKRIVKGQREELDSLLGQASGATRTEVERLARDICTPRSLALLESALNGKPTGERKPRMSPRRLIRRLTIPVGAWIHCSGNDPSLALELDGRAGRIFPYCRAEAVPVSNHWAWWLRRVQPVRLRPGIVASWGSVFDHPAPDLKLTDGDVADVVDFLNTRLLTRLARNTP